MQFLTCIKLGCREAEKGSALCRPQHEPSGCGGHEGQRLAGEGSGHILCQSIQKSEIDVSHSGWHLIIHQIQLF